MLEHHGQVRVEKGQLAQALGDSRRIEPTAFEDGEVRLESNVSAGSWRWTDIGQRRDRRPGCEGLPVAATVATYFDRELGRQRIGGSEAHSANQEVGVHVRAFGPRAELCQEH